MIFLCTKCDRAEVPLFPESSCTCREAVLNHVQISVAQSASSAQESIHQSYSYRVIYSQNADPKKRIQGFDPLGANPGMQMIPGTPVFSDDPSIQYDYLIYMPGDLSRLKSFIFCIYGGAIPLHAFSTDWFSVSGNVPSRSMVDQGIGVVFVHLSDIESASFLSKHQHQFTEVDIQILQNDIEDFVLEFPRVLLSALKHISISCLPFQIPIFLYGGSFGGYNVIMFATSANVRKNTSRQFRNEIFDGYIALNPSLVRPVDQCFISSADLKNLSKPILIIQGVFDVRVPPKHLYDLLSIIFRPETDEFHAVQPLIHLVTPEIGHGFNTSQLAFEPQESTPEHSYNAFYSDAWHRRNIPRVRAQKHTEYVRSIICEFIHETYRMEANKTLNLFHLRSIQRGFIRHGIADSTNQSVLKENTFIYGSDMSPYFLRTISRTYFDLQTRLERIVFLNFLKNKVNTFMDDVQGIAKIILQKSGKTFNIGNVVTVDQLTELHDLQMVALSSTEQILVKYSPPFNIFVQNLLINSPVEVFLGDASVSYLQSKIAEFERELSLSRVSFRGALQAAQGQPARATTPPFSSPEQENKNRIKATFLQILDENDKGKTKEFCEKHKKEVEALLSEKIVITFDSKKAHALFDFIENANFEHIYFIDRMGRNWPRYKKIKDIWEEWIQYLQHKPPSPTIHQLLTRKYGEEWWSWVGV